MAHLRTQAASLLVVLMLAVSNPGLFAEQSATDGIETLTRQDPGLLEREPVRVWHDLDMQEMRLDTDGVGVLSTQADPFVGVLAEHSSMAELHRFETLKPNDGIWRISHTRNPNGEFSLVRSTSEEAESLRVSVGGAEAEMLEPRQTLLLACGAKLDGLEMRIETGAGKVLYTGEMRCGDAVSVNRGVAQ